MYRDLLSIVKDSEESHIVMDLLLQYVGLEEERAAQGEDEDSVSENRRWELVGALSKLIEVRSTHEVLQFPGDLLKSYLTDKLIRSVDDDGDGYSEVTDSIIFASTPEQDVKRALVFREWTNPAMDGKALRAWIDEHYPAEDSDGRFSVS